MCSARPNKRPKNGSLRSKVADKPRSHRRQTVDARVHVFHRLAADGYEYFATPNRETAKWRCPAIASALFFAFDGLSYVDPNQVMIAGVAKLLNDARLGLAVVDLWPEYARGHDLKIAAR